MQRYKEEYEEGSELLWPSEKEDKITRNFYRDLSHFSKNTAPLDNKKFSLIKQIFRIFTGEGGSPSSKNNDNFNKQNF